MSKDLIDFLRRSWQRVTEVRTPIGSISLERSESEANAAFRVIAFFEDRRSITGAFAPVPNDLVVGTQNPTYCIESIRSIRELVLNETKNLSANSPLRSGLLEIGSASRDFLSSVEPRPHPLEFHRSLRLYRDKVRPHLKRIMEEYEIQPSQNMRYFLENPPSGLLPPDD